MATRRPHAPTCPGRPPHQGGKAFRCPRPSTSGFSSDDLDPDAAPEAAEAAVPAARSAHHSKGAVAEGAGLAHADGVTATDPRPPTFAKARSRAWPPVVCGLAAAALGVGVA